MLEVAAEAEHDIRVGLAKRVGGARVHVGCADVGKRRGRNDSRRRQTRSVQAHRVLDLDGREAKVGRKTAGGGANFLGRRLLVLEAPTPVLASADAHRDESLGTEVFDDTARRARQE